MKNFVNILVTFILTGFTIGLTLVQINNIEYDFGLLYVPLIIAMFAWGAKLDQDYK